MAVQIGARVSGFSDPTELLSDCHRRIEMFLRSLEAIAARSDQELSDEMRRSLDLALRYFREAAPKHTADEEESLFPRVRKLEHPELKAVQEKMEALELDHRWSEPLHTLVDGLGSKYLEQGRLSHEEVRRFRDTMRLLSAMYQRHIEVEDRQVFPVVNRVLSQEQKTQIGKEMASRRQVAVPGPDKI
jgi:hemerythrin-like domain-containing protein